jgi:hypothetical protein
MSSIPIIGLSVHVLTDVHRAINDEEYPEERTDRQYRAPAPGHVVCDLLIRPTCFIVI